MATTHEFACTGNRDEVTSRLRNVLKNRYELAGDTIDSAKSPSTAFTVHEYQPWTRVLRANAVGDIADRGQECTVRYRIGGNLLGYVLFACSAGLILTALVLVWTQTVDPLAVVAAIALPVGVLAFQGLAILRSGRRLNRLLLELFKG